MARLNLIYHVYPVSETAVAFNLEQLGRYCRVFNGRIVVHVATGKNLLSVEAVKTMLSQQFGECECLMSPNHPSGETEPFFSKLLPRVVSTNEDEFTFYAHAKGVTKPNNPCVQKWAEWMYCFESLGTGILRGLS